jgi:hypothetical protein
VSNALIIILIHRSVGTVHNGVTPKRVRPFMFASPAALRTVVNWLHTVVNWLHTVVNWLHSVVNWLHSVFNWLHSVVN